MTYEQKPKVRAPWLVSLRLLTRTLERRVRPGTVRVQVPSLRPGQEVPDSIDPFDLHLTSTLDQITERLEEQRRALGIPGLSAAIVYNQDVIWAHGFGLPRCDSRTPADEHTIYHQQSIGKLFTTTMMMMQLRDRGAICLDDPVEQYLPQFGVRWQSGDRPRITFRHLASHTSGLPMEAPLDYVTSAQFPSIEAVLQSLEDTHLLVPPMKAFKYSNLGFAVLGHALETVAGQPYKEYILTHILQPLGMTSSGFDMRAETSNQAAVGYVPAPGEGAPEVGRVIDPGAFVPAGGVWASVMDMAKFISLQFRDGPAEGAQILRGTTLRELHAPLMFIDPDWHEAIALGGVLGRVAGWGGLMVAGGAESFTSMVAYLPDLKLGMVLSMNMGVNPASLVVGALEKLLPVVTQILARDQLARHLMDPEALQKYVGHYSWPGVSELDVKISNGGLVMETQLSGGEFPVRHVGEHTFRMEGGRLAGELAVFDVDDAGQVLRLWIGNYPMDRRAPKRRS